MLRLSFPFHHVVQYVLILLLGLQSLDRQLESSMGAGDGFTSCTNTICEPLWNSSYPFHVAVDSFPLRENFVQLEKG